VAEVRIKTTNLIRDALDWAVAKCEGVSFESYRAAVAWMKRREVSDDELSAQHTYQYSTGWAQGGPIIERELICIDAGDGSYEPLRRWAAWRANAVPVKAGQGEWWGPTPLIAAMRCFVASRLGDEVDVPDELV
jgi:hypothetical protein